MEAQTKTRQEFLSRIAKATTNPDRAEQFLRFHYNSEDDTFVTPTAVVTDVSYMCEAMEYIAVQYSYEGYEVPIEEFQALLLRGETLTHTRRCPSLDDYDQMW